MPDNIFTCYKAVLGIRNRNRILMFLDLRDPDTGGKKNFFDDVKEAFPINVKKNVKCTPEGGWTLKTRQQKSLALFQFYSL
jgi:hypothetical protein